MSIVVASTTSTEDSLKLSKLLNQQFYNLLVF
jgi:hypothetical protein